MSSLDISMYWETTLPLYISHLSPRHFESFPSCPHYFTSAIFLVYFIYCISFLEVFFVSWVITVNISLSGNLASFCFLLPDLMFPVLFSFQCSYLLQNTPPKMELITLYIFIFLVGCISVLLSRFTYMNWVKMWSMILYWQVQEIFLRKCLNFDIYNLLASIFLCAQSNVFCFYFDAGWMILLGLKPASQQYTNLQF